MPCHVSAGKPENCVKNTRFLRQVSGYFGYRYPLSPENGENLDTLGKKWVERMQLGRKDTVFT